MYPYLSSVAFANRSAALEGAVEISDALLAATERLATLLAESGRQALTLGSRHFDSLAQGTGPTGAAQWLEQSQGETSRIIEQGYEIACDTHSALITAADKQVRLFDEMVRSALQRASNWAPWEGAIAFQALRSTLDGAESTIHEMSAVATQTIAVAEKEARLLTGKIAKPRAPRKS